MDFFKYIKKINKKGGIKIAFYVDVNVFSLSNVTILNADISNTSSERYRFLFIFVCRISKYTHMPKIKILYSSYGKFIFHCVSLLKTTVVCTF